MGGYGYGYGHGLMDHFGWWGFHGFGWILMILWWGLILAGLVFLLRWLFLAASKGSAKGQREDKAVEILRQRYARSEIGKEEFEEKHKDLQRIA
jgi:putative membrane protein